MTIDKNTKIFGSFSSNPGNNGNIYFNQKFQELNINALYKSFYSDNIESSYLAAKNLNFGGFAVSMPFKREILKYVDEISEECKIINAANTVLFRNGKSMAFNTDYIGISEYFKKLNNINFVYIIGDGAFASSAKYAFDLMEIDYRIINRQNWSDIHSLNSVNFFNCTPVRDLNYNITCNFIDGIPDTESGKKIAEYQALEQLKIYLKYES